MTSLRTPTAEPATTAATAPVSAIGTTTAPATAATTAAAREQLFNSRTLEAYRDTLTAGLATVAEQVARAEGPFTGVTPQQLAPRVDAVDLDRPLHDPGAALAELEQVYLRDAVHFHHPRYLAHLNCPVVIPALLAEAVLSAFNSSLDTWDQSAGGTLIERRLIDWTAGRIGFGPTGDGVFTSGGSQSNLQALLLAREEALRRLGGDRAQVPRLRVLASAAGHFSVQKSAKLLGLAADAVVTVPTGADRRMRPAALAAALERCRREDRPVMAVVATAGTTDFGTIDPLEQIAELCEQAGTWLHVDAAYGCGLLVSATRRHLLAGIERADSVTVDYHKSFFQPVSSSALLVADGTVLRHATYHADYLNPARAVRERIPNQVDKSLQTTRRFDALKLWLTLRVMGADGIGALFDEVLDRAAEAHALVAADPRFEIVTRSQLSTLVFRYLPAGQPGHPHADDANLHARTALAASGAGVVAGTTVEGRHFLKFTLLNPETTLADVAEVLDLLAGHAEQYLDRTATAA